MNVFVVYAHPSERSFTASVKARFLEGLEAGGHAWEISDLYRMGFQTDMTEAEYEREAGYRDELPLPADVLSEQEKIRRCDGIAFLYPVFWTEAPAKLVGWFDRVWTYGFAYGKRSMKTLDKALVLCVAGNTIQELEQRGQMAAMRAVMLGDRIHDRARTKGLVVLDSTSREKDPVIRERHLQTAYDLGVHF